MSKYLKRLHDIKHWLKAEPKSINDVLKLLDAQNRSVSKRQLSRDFKAIQSMLDDEEAINHFFKDGIKYFYIHSNATFEPENSTVQHAEIYKTHFYKQKITDNIRSNIKLIEKAIIEQKQLVVKLIKDDETGDNLDLDSENVLITPIKIIHHRDTYYLASFNDNLNVVEVYGLRQLKNIQIGKAFDNINEAKIQVDNELKKRFGVTKNINNKIYDIEIKFTPVLGRFIENHHWHESQKIKKIKGDYILYLKCGINRELMGWLFQWMYNVEVIQPKVLKNLYEKTLLENKSTMENKSPFVHRNIFNRQNNR